LNLSEVVHRTTTGHSQEVKLVGNDLKVIEKVSGVYSGLYSKPLSKTLADKQLVSEAQVWNDAGVLVLDLNVGKEARTYTLYDDQGARTFVQIWKPYDEGDEGGRSTGWRLNEMSFFDGAVTKRYTRSSSFGMMERVIVSLADGSRQELDI